MNRRILIFFFLFLFSIVDTDPTTEDRHEIYLPMKKDHKYGDDICYYREIDEKLDYAVYYVKPCEKGKYCEDEVSRNQPYGFCRDILDKPTIFSSYGEACSSDAECQEDLYCDSTCKYKCPSGENVYQLGLNTFTCFPDSYKKVDDKVCILYEPHYTQLGSIKYFTNGYAEYNGKYPGLPKQCGIKRFTPITDYDYANPSTVDGQTTYKSYTRYIKQSDEWCSIGEAKDGEFVYDKKYCKSGFTLNFYRNGGLNDPSYYNENNPINPVYDAEKEEMCVTPIEIDLSNPLVGCVVTYKIGDGQEQKYNADKYDFHCDTEDLIKSQIYREFIEQFNNASEEDKMNCYQISNNIVGDCQNLKLIKFFYFYNNHIKDYIFYKDREKLETVLDFKIQKIYHRYYQSSSYHQLNFLFFILFLILL